MVLSRQLEVCQVLIRTLDRLSADVISCSTRSQVDEVLARRKVDLIFCDEYLPDGSYSDLIHTNHWNHKIPRIVVATRHASDVEMVLIRALRDECQQAAALQVA